MTDKKKKPKVEGRGTGTRKTGPGSCTTTKSCATRTSALKAQQNALEALGKKTSLVKLRAYYKESSVADIRKVTKETKERVKAAGGPVEKAVKGKKAASEKKDGCVKRGLTSKHRKDLVEKTFKLTNDLNVIRGVPKISKAELNKKVECYSGKALQTVNKQLRARIKGGSGGASILNPVTAVLEQATEALSAALPSIGGGSLIASASQIGSSKGPVFGAGPSPIPRGL